MIKHIILWQLKDDIEDKNNRKERIKNALEGLKNQIKGLTDIKVETTGFESSTADLMLNSTFETREDLINYSSNPLHVAAANSEVRPYIKNRVAFDYIEKE